MKSLRRLLTRVSNLVTNREHDERLREEIEGHIALQPEENLHAGLSPVEARRQAILKFGPVEAIEQDYRAEQSLLWIGDWLQDVRLSLRLLRKSPGFTLVAVLTLANSTPGIAPGHQACAFASRVPVRPDNRPCSNLHTAQFASVYG